ncbi:MAG: GntR family transcriptional regulator [Thermomicrobiaceae bacterium]|nr:GntR family transcriptional regulator [Thermomicrobiaceae bacterium]
MAIGPIDRLGESLARSAYATLRDAITRGAIPPGARLREQDLAQRLGVSRTPVREALRQLSSEGLVRLVPGRGALVTDLDPRTLREIYAVRAALEGMAAGLAAGRIAPPALGLLEGLVALMGDLVAAGDDERLREANQRFHATIAEESGNHYLARLLRDMEPQLERFRFIALRVPSRRAEAHREHVALFEAIRRGDAAEAERQARLHAERALAWRLARAEEWA